MKFEKLSLDKFNNSSLKEFEAKNIVGGVSTYVVSADRETGSICDAGIEHDAMS